MLNLFFYLKGIVSVVKRSSIKSRRGRILLSLRNALWCVPVPVIQGCTRSQFQVGARTQCQVAKIPGFVQDPRYKESSCPGSNCCNFAKMSGRVFIATFHLNIWIVHFYLLKISKVVLHKLVLHVNTSGTVWIAGFANIHANCSELLLYLCYLASVSHYYMSD